ncbi:MAG: DUF4258 domain-containing protein [Geitlerinemataceae cyanobacterium]
MNFEFSNHALNELQKRKISRFLVEEILKNPQQTIPQDDEITIFQSQIAAETEKRYLIRIFVNITVNPPRIVTLYRTSKIAKYWQQS